MRTAHGASRLAFSLRLNGAATCDTARESKPQIAKNPPLDADE